MTLTTLDVAELTGLDWEPGCEIKDCHHGHPKATHYCQVVGINGHDHRWDLVVCGGCAFEIVAQEYRQKGHYRCADCGCGRRFNIHVRPLEES